MFTLRAYERCSTKEQVLEYLNSNSSCLILGGNHWARQGSRKFDLGLDLSGLEHYNEIELLQDGGLRIGAGVSYGMMERSPLLLEYAHGVIPYALKGIVGSQLRNTASVGGSLYSRFAFSDSIPVLLALNAGVELAQQGYMSLEAFLELPSSALKKDFMLALYLPAEVSQIAADYQAFRHTANDFPLLCMALSYQPDEGVRLVIGARPGLARLADKGSAYLARCFAQSHSTLDYSLEELLSYIQEDMSFGSCQGAPSEYRISVLSRLLPTLIENVHELSLHMDSKEASYA